MWYLAYLGVFAFGIAYYKEMPMWAMVIIMPGLYICGLLDGSRIVKRKIAAARTSKH